MFALLLSLAAGCAPEGSDAPRIPLPDGPDTGRSEDTSPPEDTWEPDDTGPLGDTADTADTGTPDETGEPPDACAGVPEEGRDMGVAALLARLDAQGCLHDEDRAALVAIVDTFFAESQVWCDAVWRVSSADGIVFDEAPERVRAHASVPDVAIDADGAHHLLFNDLQPGLFAALLEESPEVFWERGLAGIGGLGLAVDAGAGFHLAPLDLSLDGLALVVDPDVSLLADGTWRIATFQVPVAELDGTTWDPMRTPAPHDYHRAVGPDLASFDPGPLVLAGRSGMRGGADPTILDVPGGEILFVGDVTSPIVGWSAPGGVYADPDAAPDVVTTIGGVAPDAIRDPAGVYRLYYKPAAALELHLATSADGRDWTARGVVSQHLGDVSNPSIALDPDGRWWLYYNQRDEDCSSGMQPPVAQPSDGSASGGPPPAGSPPVGPASGG